MKFIYFADPVIYTINTIDPNQLVDNLPNNSTLKKLQAKYLNQESVIVVTTNEPDDSNQI